MPEISQDFEIWAGEDVNVQIQGISGINDINTITDIRWRVTETADSTDPLIEKRIINLPQTNGWYTINGIFIYEETATIVIALYKEDTIYLGGSRYYHELRVVDGAGGANIATVGRMKINNSNFVDILELGQHNLTLNIPVQNHINHTQDHIINANSDVPFSTDFPNSKNMKNVSNINIPISLTQSHSGKLYEDVLNINHTMEININDVLTESP